MGEITGQQFIYRLLICVTCGCSFDTVVTVRSEEKGKQILDAHSDTPKEKLSYVIVKDVAQEGAFDEVSRAQWPSKRASNTKLLEQAVQSNPPFDYVLHTASPFHFNVQDPVADFLDPAIKGTTGILKAIKSYAPSVKRVVITSSFAAIINPKKHPKVYSEKDWNPVTWEEAMDHANVYRASKVRRHRLTHFSNPRLLTTWYRRLPRRPHGTSLRRKNPTSTLQPSTHR